MTYILGLAVLLLALTITVIAHRRLGLGRTARHRADVDVPNLWTAWRQR